MADTIATNNNTVIVADWFNDANRKTYGFTSVAHMITIAGAFDGQQVDLLNYYEGTSGGGGEVYWDATSTETADDGMIFQVTGVTTGRWKRPLGIVNIKQYGAKGDGTTDDSTAIQAAFDYYTNEGRAIFIPNGDYRINTSIIITDTSNQGFHVYGESVRSSQIHNYSGDGVFVFTGVTFFKALHLHDFSILNKAANTGTYPYMIYVDVLAQQTHIHDLWIDGEDFAGNGMYFENAEMFSLRNIYMRRLANSSGIDFQDMDLDRGNFTIDTVMIHKDAGAVNPVAYGMRFLSGSVSDSNSWHTIKLVNFKTVGVTTGIKGPTDYGVLRNISIDTCYFESATTAIDLVATAATAAVRGLEVKNTTFSTCTTCIDVDYTKNAKIELNTTLNAITTFLNVRSNCEDINFGKQFYSTNPTNRIVDASNIVGIELDTSWGRLANSATPSVYSGVDAARDNWGKNFYNQGGTSITDFLDGFPGQEITIYCATAVTITDGTNIFLSGSTNFVMKATDTLKLILYTNGNWYETGRSVN